ncbi:MAG: signal recognition particle receptor subunit alpha, partial [Frankiales bacterium]|nr:signal recognition particle receptor subunit alpha [Frankiales bacterium]
MEFVVLGIVLAVFAVGALVAFLKAPTRRELPPSSEAPTVELPPPAGDAAEPPAAGTTVAEPPVARPPVADTVVVEPAPAAPTVDVPPPSAGRLVRLRARLARSQGTFGRGLLTLLSRDTIDDDTWDEVEDTLLTADVGVAATRQLVENLRTQVLVLGARTPDQVRTLLRDQLL